MKDKNLNPTTEPANKIDINKGNVTDPPAKKDSEPANDLQNKIKQLQEENDQNKGFINSIKNLFVKKDPPKEPEKAPETKNKNDNSNKQVAELLKEVEELKFQNKLSRFGVKGDKQVQYFKFLLETKKPKTDEEIEKMVKEELSIFDTKQAATTEGEGDNKTNNEGGSSGTKKMDLNINLPSGIKLGEFMKMNMFEKEKLFKNHPQEYKMLVDKMLRRNEGDRRKGLYLLDELEAKNETFLS